VSAQLSKNSIGKPLLHFKFGTFKIMANRIKYKNRTLPWQEIQYDYMKSREEIELMRERYLNRIQNFRMIASEIKKE
jgi:hypothetical protein